MIPLVGLALFSASLRAEEDSAPEQNPFYIKGINALKDHLPDLAIEPLKASLGDFKDNPQALTRIHIKLAEALVRTGRLQKHLRDTQKLATSALDYLAEYLSEENPAAIFWSAHAHVLQGELTQAATLFAELEKTEDRGLREQSSLSRAYILSALGDTRGAHALLKNISGDQAQTPLSQDALLLSATMLIEQQRASEAEEILNKDFAPLSRQQQIHLTYLRARLTALSDKRQAIPLLRKIIDDPDPVQPLIRHSAQVFIAECLRDTEQVEDAFTTLVNLIDKHQRTPLLEIAFHRLHSCASTEPLLKRLEEQLGTWADFKSTSPALQPQPSGAVIVSPGAETRTGYALFFHAACLAQRNNKDSNDQAERRLSWLVTNMPAHPFWDRSVLEMAKLQIASRRKKTAIATLETLNESPGSSAVDEESARLLARLYFEDGNFTSASSAFLRAHRSFPLGEEDISAVNAGISLLRAGDETSFRGLLESLGPSKAHTTLLLERALHEASLKSESAAELLGRFLSRHPDHPRGAEAQLALLEASAHSIPNELSALQRIASSLSALDASSFNFSQGLRYLNLHLQIASGTGKWEPAIKSSKEFLKSHPASRMTSLIQFKLAEAYFHNGDMGEAQSRFQMIASSTTDDEMSETALFYAARSALKVGGENSDTDAEDFLNTIIGRAGPLATDAMLLLARSQIDRSPRAALATLASLLQNKNPFLLDARMLAGEAHREIGDPDNLVAALKIYDDVIARPETPYSVSNHLFFLKGQIFEDLKKPREALEAYYHVVRRENLHLQGEPSEWFYFSRCAFAAVELLSKGALPRWAASVEILRLVENSASPWREEAGRRRLEIELEHQLFDGE